MENEEAIDHSNLICRCRVYRIVRLGEALELDTQVLLGNRYQDPWPENQVTYEATPIYLDISGAQALYMNKRVSAKSKHIDLKYHYFKAALMCGIIVLRDVASKDNPADLLTKLLGF